MCCPRRPTHPSPPFTLAIDIGGTGLKASVLDSTGAMVADRVKIPTTYPLAPDKLVEDLAKLTKPLPDYERVSAGFPGMIREGHVLTAPHFVLKSGPGSDVDPALKEKWTDFPLADALSQQPRAPDQGRQRRRPAGRGRDRRPRLRARHHARHGVRHGLLLRRAPAAALRVRPHPVPQRRDLQRPARRAGAQGDRRGALGEARA